MNKARQKKIIVNFLRSPIYNKESSEPLNFDNSIYVQGHKLKKNLLTMAGI